ncbi:histidine kinase [Streptomyces sp. NPDC023723]|uniref:sensor histidine kinase n=1 Tax=Streptomyces sp. NPDC023723 TaxID=3154323 RepID=UPI0033C1741C
MRSLIRSGVPPLVAAAGTVVLSAASPWWAVATAVLAGLGGARPGSGRAAAGVLAGVLGVAVGAVGLVPSWIGYGDRFVAVLVGAGVLPWCAGRFRRQYRALVRAGWERAEHLEREQRLVADQARLRERARIAQDMHDLLGHDLSLIALSAGAMKLAPGLLAEHREAAGEIRARAAAAVDRLGEVIGILREDAAPAATARVEDLVDGAAAAGLPVTLTIEGEPGDLPPAAERAVRRVVQESLTNAARHAPGAAVSVAVRYTAREVAVRVTDEGTGAGPVPGGGRGLIGLDERVRLAGGALAYGPRGAGFAVTAQVPRAPGAAPAPRLATLPQEHQRERRRLRRVGWAALWMPLTAVVLLGAGLRAWDVYLVRASVLPPDTYAGLRTGQDRARLAPLLPARQSPHRPAAPAPSGTRCEYYAMTANPFADDSGDVYRLCFHADRLVLKQKVSP